MILRPRIALLLLLPLLAVAVGAAPQAAPPAPAPGAGDVLALTGARILVSPEAPAIPRGVVLIAGGRIVAVGAAGRIAVPAGASVRDCTGATLAAGFWNCHVHLIAPAVLGADRLPPAALGGWMREHFARYGTTAVFDLGSPLANTAAIRRRIAAGEVDGPRVLTTGEPLFPPHGTPDYAVAVIRRLGIHPPEIETARQGVAAVRDRLAGGADAIKIYAASPIGNGKVATFLLPAARAVAAAAHAAGRLVFAHPQTAAGIEVARAAGVDVLAHTVPREAPWSAAAIAALRRRDISLIPTLRVFELEYVRMGESPEATRAVVARVSGQLGAYSRAGGRILFGTDCGYTGEYDDGPELALMAGAGLSFRQVLAALTTAPAERFGTHAGRIAPGYDADLVLLEGESDDVASLSRIRATYRAGRLLYDAAARPR